MLFSPCKASIISCSLAIWHARSAMFNSAELR
ncbi:hypothetical protein TIFTF001_027632 [Ficus carica]|uniref:Uncharacterized protein n=1 Tax=Ficus carica TaxID=3494 RepID=A0AA88DND9_FICCA|nr:hypothetical protein TIFTF001_027632 [Ficus carica]